MDGCCIILVSQRAWRSGCRRLVRLDLGQELGLFTRDRGVDQRVGRLVGVPRDGELGPLSQCQRPPVVAGRCRGPLEKVGEPAHDVLELVPPTPVQARVPLCHVVHDRLAEDVSAVKPDDFGRGEALVDPVGRLVEPRDRVLVHGPVGSGNIHFLLQRVLQLCRKGRRRTRSPVELAISVDLGRHPAGRPVLKVALVEGDDLDVLFALAGGGGGGRGSCVGGRESCYFGSRCSVCLLGGQDGGEFGLWLAGHALCFLGCVVLLIVERRV